MFENYADYEYLLASTQLAFAMLGMGALLAPADFAVVFRRPLQLGVGLGLQLVAAPLVAATIAGVLPVPAGIAAGLILVSAVPGGTMSNVLTLFGRGNIALSISLTAVMSVLCLITTPLILRRFAGMHLPPGFEMPTARIAFEIGVVLLIPLALGMLIGARLGARREGFSRGCIRTSIALIVVMVVGSSGSGRLVPTQYGLLGPVSLLALSASFLLVAYLVSSAVRMSTPDRVAVSIEVSFRNTNLAVMVKASLFPAVTGVLDPVGDGVFFVALLYGGVALPVAMIPLFLGRRAARRSQRAGGAQTATHESQLDARSTGVHE